MHNLRLLLALILLALACPVWAQEPSGKAVDLPVSVQKIEEQVQKNYPHLDKLYQHFHSHPELSLAEEKTSQRLAEELRAAEFEVTERVGGYGVVGVYKNGEGPTILVRADMDGLPIIEKTGVPYASNVMTKDRHGRTVGVMHACGHDVNITCLVGLARLMHEFADQWSGTLVLVGQPAEEIGSGARAMLADGLFLRFPRPNFGLAMHCDARFPSGVVNYRLGQMQANVDTVDILIRGRGGHGAAPHTTIDPIVIAAKLVLDLQTIVARELNPLSPAVVTVGSIHGGTKHNIIADEVKLQLTVRTVTDEDRRQVLDAIRRKALAAAKSAGAPEPKVEVDEDQFTPTLVNDVPLGEKTIELFQQILGPEAVHERPMSLGGEDFAEFIRAGMPGFYYFLGAQPPELVKAAQAGGEPLTRTHTDAFAPDREPTIKTGVLTMTAAVLNLLDRPGKNSEK